MLQHDAGLLPELVALSVRTELDAFPSVISLNDSNTVWIIGKQNACTQTPASYWLYQSYPTYGQSHQLVLPWFLLLCRIHFPWLFQIKWIIFPD